MLLYPAFSLSHPILILPFIGVGDDFSMKYIALSRVYIPNSSALYASPFVISVQHVHHIIDCWTFDSIIHPVDIPFVVNLG